MQLQAEEEEIRTCLAKSPLIEVALEYVKQRQSDVAQAAGTGNCAGCSISEGMQMKRLHWTQARGELLLPLLFSFLFFITLKEWRVLHQNISTKKG